MLQKDMYRNAFFSEYVHMMSFLMNMYTNIYI